MKIRTLAVIGTAVTVLLCGCGKNDSEDSGSAQANAEVSSGAKKQITIDPERKVTLDPEKKTRLTAKYAPKITVPPTAVPPTQADYETSISGFLSAGIDMKTPKGINLYNGSEQRIISPNHVPTTSDPLIVSDEEGNSVNILAAAGIKYDEFEAMEQKDVEQTFLTGLEGIYEDIEITSYQKGTYAEFPGIRMDMNFKFGGEDLNQTILMINAVNKSVTDTVAGYCYTITYTNKTGDMEIDDSISSIGIRSGLLAASYPDPEECAEAQKNGTFERWASRKNADSWIENAQPWNGAREPIPEGN